MKLFTYAQKSASLAVHISNFNISPNLCNFSVTTFLIGFVIYFGIGNEALNINQIIWKFRNNTSKMCRRIHILKVNPVFHFLCVSSIVIHIADPFTLIMLGCIR
jgi:hypothetical protein